MRTESAYGLRQRRTQNPFDAVPAAADRSVRFETTAGEWVSAGIEKDNTAKLQQIWLNLAKVQKYTDPVAMTEDQRFFRKTIFFLRNYERKAAAFAAFDHFRKVEDQLTADHWFCAFVLLDKLDSRGQLSAFEAYLSLEASRQHAAWSLEVMRHWLTRHSVGENRALLRIAVRHLIGLWKTCPPLQAATAALLAYLLCPDSGIKRPVAAREDWASVLKLLPRWEASADTGAAPAFLSDAELVIAAGLLRAARHVERELGNSRWSAKLLRRLGNALKNAEPFQGSLDDFAVLLRHAESRCRKRMNYQEKLDEYTAREAERQAANRQALERVGRFATKAGEIALEIVPLAEFLLNLISAFVRR